MTFIPPDPILDRREETLVAELTVRYTKLIAPGHVTTAVSKAGKRLFAMTPERIRRLAKEAVDVASEWEIVKKVIEHAGRGFVELNAQASRFTYSHDGILSALSENGIHIPRFEEICAARSYRLESVARRQDLVDLFAALAEGAATGARSAWCPL